MWDKHAIVSGFHPEVRPGLSLSDIETGRLLKGNCNCPEAYISPVLSCFLRAGCCHNTSLVVYVSHCYLQMVQTTLTVLPILMVQKDKVVTTEFLPTTRRAMVPGYWPWGYWMQALCQPPTCGLGHQQDSAALVQNPSGHCYSPTAAKMILLTFPFSEREKLI